METVSCNLCGSADYRVVYSMPDAGYFKDEWFTIVECKSCGLGFVNPRPTYSEIFRYYPPHYYDYFDVERNFHERRYEAEAKFVQDASDGNGNKTLFDIGCANGDFPRYMQKLGWQVEGGEASPHSKSITDFKVYTQEFTQTPIYEPRYGTITAWAVLEHVHDPMSYFKKASVLLKPGGLFIFLVTNFKSLSSRCLFREDVPRHLYFFTEETIRRYLSHSGFELVRTDYSDKVYEMRPVNWLRYYVYRYLKGRELEWKDLPPKRMKYFARHHLHNDLSSNLRYIASNKFAVMDRLLMPVFEKYQMLSKSYGIVTYTARRL